jgi:hypothetical protein
MLELNVFKELEVGTFSYGPVDDLAGALVDAGAKCLQGTRGNFYES